MHQLLNAYLTNIAGQGRMPKRAGAIVEGEHWDNGGRRCGIENRKFSYTAHVPERRSGQKRRRGRDRRHCSDHRISPPLGSKNRAGAAKNISQTAAR